MARAAPLGRAVPPRVRRAHRRALVRLSRRPSDARQSFGRLAAGHLLVLIDRGVYWQIAYLIPKAAADGGAAPGGAGPPPRLGRRAGPLPRGPRRRAASWEDVRTLRVQVDRLRRWFRPGLLASATPPTPCPHRRGRHQPGRPRRRGRRQPARPAAARRHLSTRHLARVQLRRLLPTVVVQWGQRTIQDRFLSPLLAGRVPAKGPLVLRPCAAIRSCRASRPAWSASASSPSTCGPRPPPAPAPAPAAPAGSPDRRYL